MKELLKKFLNDDLTINCSHDEFDYRVESDYTKNFFKVEYSKFLGLYNVLFYNENRFVTSINSYEIRINKRDLIHLFNLYIYAKNNNLKTEKIVLIEFLYTYCNAINSREYCENYPEYYNSKKDFSDVLNELNLRIEFYNLVPKHIENFYKKMLKYGLENNIFIDNEIINRIFNNISVNNKFSNSLIRLFIKHKSNLSFIIKYDKQVKAHIETYMEYIYKSLAFFDGYNYAKEVIVNLSIKKVLRKKDLKTIINLYIKIVNDVCNELKLKENSFIQGLAKINTLKEQLVFLLQRIEVMNKKYKIKIKECLIQLLRLKRYILSDEQYVNSEMYSKEFKQKISSKEIDKHNELLMKNKLLLYSVSKINFTQDVGNALESYAKYPIQSMVTRYNIDCQNQVYSLNIEDKKKNNDNFKKYFDEKGKEYTDNHPKLLNKLDSNYYEELLKYLSKIFNLQQSLLISFLSSEQFNELVNSLHEELKYEYYNDYSLIVANILSIEINVIKILKKHGIDEMKGGFENINKLVEIYYDNSKVIDGLMYINYTLYEKSGLNLRNNAAHGTLINTDLRIPLIVSYAGLIFISWLSNE